MTMAGTKRRTRNPGGNIRKRRRTMSRYNPAMGARRLNFATKLGNRRRDTYFFTRRFNGGTLAGNAAYTPYVAGTALTFSQLPGVADFSNLFDFYKITYITFTYHMRIAPDAQAAATAVYPRMWYCVDYDDGAPPASLDELRERAKTKMVILSPHRPVRIGFRPSVLAETYRTAVSTAYAPKWGMWLDADQTNVPHYGLKVAIDDFANTNYRLETEVKMWFACKSTK